MNKDIKIKALLVDDEPKAIQNLTYLLQKHCPVIEIVGDANTVDTALVAIANLSPDVVFLDVEMPEKFGYELFDSIEKPNFHTIFVTAYEDYALKAFEVSALDYLLKPIEVSKLKLAVEKVIEKHTDFPNRVLYDVLNENISSKQLKKIMLPIMNGFEFVLISDILMIEADRMYTKLYSLNNQPTFVSKPIKYFVDLLENDKHFFKSHRSFLINLNHVKRFIKQDGGIIEMENGIQVPISRGNLDEFRERMGEI